MDQKEDKISKSKNKGEELAKYNKNNDEIWLRFQWELNYTVIGTQEEEFGSKCIK